MGIDTSKWLTDCHKHMWLPGSAEAIADLPSGDKGCCDIGIVHQHRFAFYYWAKFAAHNNAAPPVMLSLDSHDDVGGEGDFPADEVDALDPDNNAVLGAFCWLRLHPLNDGQIAPALYANYFSDVYVLSHHLSCNTRILDWREKGKHRVRCVTKESIILDALREAPAIYLDIDLDYFVNHPSLPNAMPWERKRIRRFLRNKTGLIQSILPRVVGMTIALEPRHCGGLVNSLQILSAINSDLFQGTLGADNTTWRNEKK